MNPQTQTIAVLTVNPLISYASAVFDYCILLGNWCNHGQITYLRLFHTICLASFIKWLWSFLDLTLTVLNDSGENSLMKSLCTIQINYSDSGFYLKELHTTASEDLNRCWNAHHGPALLLQICFGGRSSRTNVPIPQEYLSGPAVDRGCGSK